MDRGQVRIPIGRPWLSRGMALFAGLLLCGCTALHLNPAPMPQAVVTPEPPAPAPLPEAAKPAAEAAPAQMASVERPPPSMIPPRPRPPPVTTPRPKPSEPPPPPPSIPDMNTLIGADFDGILNVFRSPDTVQKNALYVVWIYSPPGCTLQLFFYPDIRTTQFHLLKFDLKSTLRDVPTDGPQCMQGILAPEHRGAPAP